MKDNIRRVWRRVVYATPIHRWLGLGKARFDGLYWDQQLSGAFSNYLGGTISVEARNALVLSLLRIVHPSTSHILDVGCASGSLARSPGAEGLNYVGVDISAATIEEARRLSPDCRFQAARLEEYMPDRAYDAVIFSEVLYYLAVADAVREYRRYAAFLAVGGLVVISMKHDPKSERIMQAIAKESRWITGMLTQEKAEAPGWGIRWDSARPAYLIGIFRPS